MIACQHCGKITRKNRCECIYFCLKHSDQNNKPITRSQCRFCWEDCPYRNRVWDSILNCFVVLQKSSAQSDLDGEITEQNWKELDKLRQSDAVQQISQDEVQRLEALFDQGNASEMSEDLFYQQDKCEE